MAAEPQGTQDLAEHIPAWPAQRAFRERDCQTHDKRRALSRKHGCTFTAITSSTACTQGLGVRTCNNSAAAATFLGPGVRVSIATQHASMPNRLPAAAAARASAPCASGVRGPACRSLCRLDASASDAATLALVIAGRALFSASRKSRCNSPSGVGVEPTMHPLSHMVPAARACSATSCSCCPGAAVASIALVTSVRACVAGSGVIRASTTAPGRAAAVSWLQACSQAVTAGSMASTSAARAFAAVTSASARSCVIKACTAVNSAASVLS